MGNRWIVAYNPYLALKYNCHINVEVCASISSVKYLFKYVYKGHDCDYVEIKEINTITILGHSMHEQSHSVKRLAVHLPGEEYVSGFGINLYIFMNILNDGRRELKCSQYVFFRFYEFC